MSDEIIVRGEGQARAMPDRARITVAVEGDGASRDAAYGEAAQLAKRVDEVITEYQSAIEQNRTAALVVQPKTRWRKGESVRTGWYASRSTVLEVVDFARLGDLIAEVAAAGGAISGPFWQLDSTNPVYGEARRQAAQDARRRAGEYAETLGLEIVAIAWIAEPGLRKGNDVSAMGRYEAVAYAAAAPTAGGAGDDVIDVTPDEMTVRVAVEVGFSFRAT